MDNTDAPEEQSMWLNNKLLNTLCCYCYVGQLVKRHAGVLGLAALVDACPYTVPEWLPSVLDHISDHLRDPAPIQVRVSSMSIVSCN